MYKKCYQVQNIILYITVISLNQMSTFYNIEKIKKKKKKDCIQLFAIILQDKNNIYV